ncbi:uncharacterized protein LOC131434202 [Malaya genurostris]|uniref:uncharacterized protein LOC131434202 n=1 Tax=Malaya genurostris TaxID=325434 RepID=UPI0026F3D552|nr:uncharacterized protein LOC131434202 [Malaya genurostris]
MAVSGNYILVMALMSMYVSGVISVGPPVIVPCGQCPPNEVLRQSPPSCEPTCYEDCQHTPRLCPHVHKPSCVCKPGYVRNNGVCIPRNQCFGGTIDRRGYEESNERFCHANEDLLRSPPCCEPTCFDDCSNRICPLVFVDKPTCVCKTGLVRHNGMCISPRKCPSGKRRHPNHERSEFAPRPESSHKDISSHTNSRDNNDHYDHYDHYEGSAGNGAGNGARNGAGNGAWNGAGNGAGNDADNDGQVSNSNIGFKDPPTACEKCLVCSHATSRPNTSRNNQASNGNSFQSPASSQQQLTASGRQSLLPTAPPQYKHGNRCNGCLPPPPVAKPHPCGACNKNKF